MELIYSTRRKPYKCEPPCYESGNDPDVIKPICTISTCNVIAFSSPTDLSDTDGDNWAGHVYVCDIDTPWNSHEVTSTTDPVTVLEWDCEGKHLLIGTLVGEVSVYGQKDYLFNEWTCLYTAKFQGEHIIEAVFFHNGRRIVTLEKKADVLITDRIQTLRSTPTLKGIGGVACEGACIITATGLLGAITPPANSDTVQARTVSECLRSTRDHITNASFAHKNGNLLIAVVCVALGRRASIRCYVCSASRVAYPTTVERAPAASLALQPLPTIYLDDPVPPSSITWCLREDTDSLLIAGATLSLWKLTERSHAIHKLFAKGPIQGSTTPGSGPKPPSDCFNTVVWQQTAAWSVETGGHVASGRLPLTAPHALLATAHALHLRARDNQLYMCTAPVVTSRLENSVTAGTPPKKPKYGSSHNHEINSGSVSCVDISWMGGVGVVVDTHAQLHVYKLPQPWADLPMQLAVQHAVSLLEYSMVSGYDCLDILMTLKPNLVEAVYELLTESFQRQPQSVQQYYYQSWLKIRIALCRLCVSTQSTVSALSSMQALQAVWSASGAALRPDERAEQTPLAAALSSLYDYQTLIERDKTLLALESKTDLPNEPLVLQALRRPLQRVVDIAVTLLAAVAATATTSAAHHQSRGYELWSEPSALTLLRKAVIVARACGRGGDVLSRPLARLSTCLTPKPDLIEECASLSTQMASARVWDALPRCNVSAPHGKSWPLYFEYGVEPEHLRYVPEPPGYAQCDATPLSSMDSIRYMYLGGGARPAKWRQCGRCGGRALAASLPAKHPLQRAYDARYSLNCRCGSKWTLFSNI